MVNQQLDAIGNLVQSSIGQITVNGRQQVAEPAKVGAGLRRDADNHSSGGTGWWALVSGNAHEQQPRGPDAQLPSGAIRR